MREMVLFDVAEEVLLRLPVKDIVRCKSVCKSWYSLISSCCFVEKHVKFICNKEENNNKQLGNRRIDLTKRYVISYGNTFEIPAEWRLYNLLRIQGSCNGLLCMSSNDNRICLTNPSTREFRKLQKPPILPKNITYVHRYGFGYDSSTHDYKLVMAINQGCDGALVQVLSFKSNVWKLFGHVNYRFDDRMPAVLFNGALHWFFYNANDVNRDKLFFVSFDLAKEEFTEIPQPDDALYVGNYRNKLGIFQDRLCICHIANNGRPYGIWVMNKYNVKESWELLPNGCEMKDRVHYMIKDNLQSRKMPTYFCCADTFLSRTGKHIQSPIFVQTLVSPFVNDQGRPSDAKQYKRIVEAGSSKECREIEEALTLKDGEKNELDSDDEDGQTERKKRKGKGSWSRKKTIRRKKERLM